MDDGYCFEILKLIIGKKLRNIRRKTQVNTHAVNCEVSRRAKSPGWRGEIVLMPQIACLQSIQNGWAKCVVPCQPDVLAPAILDICWPNAVIPAKILINVSGI